MYAHRLVMTTVKNKIKELGWIALFFLVLAAFTVPVVLLSRQYVFEVTIFHQAVIVIAVTWICQKIYGRSIIVGKVDSMTLRNMALGFAMGSALMFVPVTILCLGDWVRWEAQAIDFQSWMMTVVTLVAAAATEEFLFRGFIFQRLLSLGVWPAQVLMGGYFLLTHVDNPDLHGQIKWLAMANIFLASLVFGFTVIQTKGLTMAIALHAGANLVQGALLGFGVSGHGLQSILRPRFTDAPIWLTGGAFGLEGSLPGLVCIAILLWTVHPSKITCLIPKAS